MRAHRQLLACLLAASMLHVSSGAFADEPDRLFTEGAAAFAANKMEEALAKFRAAWELRKSYDLAGGMAQAEIALGRDRDAAEHLSYALRNFPVTAKAEKRVPLEEALATLRKKLATLEISTNVEGAEVLVNGRSAGKTPLDAEVFVEAGQVTIVARASGHEESEQRLVVGKGERKVVSLAQQPKARSTLPLFFLGGTAVAALGVGVGLAVASTSQGAEAQRLRDAYVATYGLKPCAAAGAPIDECNKIGDRLRSQDTFGNVAIGAFIGAGVLAGGALAYGLYARGTSGAHSARLVPLVGVNGAGMILTGSF